MYDLLREDNIRRILVDIALNNMNVSFKLNPITQEISYFVGDNPLDKRTLQLLLENKILRKAKTESLIACPFDGSLSLNAVLFCPIHKLPLKKVEIYEDKATGAILQGKPPTALAVRRGYYLKCEKGETVVNPAFYFRCVQGHEFTLESAIIAYVDVYEVDQEKVEQIRKYFETISGLNKVLTEKQGYKISASDRKIRGLSGVSYEFDIKATKGEDTLLVYFLSGEKIEEMLSLLPKLFDITQSNGSRLKVLLIIANEKISEDLLHMFDRYNVKIIKGSDPNKIIRSFEENAQ